MSGENVPLKPPRSSCPPLRKTTANTGPADGQATLAGFRTTQLKLPLPGGSNPIWNGVPEFLRERLVSFSEL